MPAFDNYGGGDLLIGFAMLAVQFVVIILERLASLFGCDCAEQK